MVEPCLQFSIKATYLRITLNHKTLYKTFFIYMKHISQRLILYVTFTFFQYAIFSIK